MCLFSYHYRKTQTWEQISTDTTTGKPTLLSQNNYNELGQLQTKHLHSTDSVNFLQDVNYAYNERGWLLNSSAPLFSKQLQYNDTSGVKGISPIAQYNGNIASQTWQSANATNNSYLYTYDRLNRLTSGITADNQFAELGISYDQGGNIQALNRVFKGALIDSLAYLYKGNQLMVINDRAPYQGSIGYRLFGSKYGYDGNGNMIADLNKGYTTSYNILNLPETIRPNGNILKTRAGVVPGRYYYDAAGQKLAVIKAGNNQKLFTYYNNGLQYDPDTTTHMQGISFIQTEEGRALPDSAANYNYEYTLADHLGNSRVSFATVGDTAHVIQQDDYMPFGMEISGLYKDPKNEYLYNKKELQEETGLYDYGARFYDPVVARFTTIDPLATKYPWYCTYQFAGNEVPNAIDRGGLEPAYYHTDGSLTIQRDNGLQRPLSGEDLNALKASSASKTEVGGGDKVFDNASEGFTNAGTAFQGAGYGGALFTDGSSLALVPIGEASDIIGAGISVAHDLLNGNLKGALTTSTVTAVTFGAGKGLEKLEEAGKLIKIDKTILSSLTATTGKLVDKAREVMKSDNNEKKNVPPQPKIAETKENKESEKKAQDFFKNKQKQ